jgi:hypothetical protein
MMKASVFLIVAAVISTNKPHLSQVGERMPGATTRVSIQVSHQNRVEQSPRYATASRQDGKAESDRDQELLRELLDEQYREGERPDRDPKYGR